MTPARFVHVAMALRRGLDKYRAETETQAERMHLSDTWAEAGVESKLQSPLAPAQSYMDVYPDGEDLLGDVITLPHRAAAHVMGLVLLNAK